MRKPLTLLAGALLASGAAAQPPPKPLPSASAPAPARLPPLAWSPMTRSPQPLAAVPASDVALLSLCGAPDAALSSVARRNLDRQRLGLDILPSDELLFTLRSTGEPHPWPRAWPISGGKLAEAELHKRFGAWASGWRTLGIRRCGVARGLLPDGAEVVSVIGVDALADLSPLPTTARVGQWLTLEGAMLVPATAVKVVLLGPRGAPKSVPASLHQGRVRASFAVDQPGAWLVQVLATVSTGPRPVLEAMVHAGTAAPAQFARAAAPGEEAGKGAKDDADALMRMMNAARAAEGQPALARDAALDALALEHAEAMQKARLVGHDVGAGDPSARLQAAGYQARVAGENVATSDRVEHAHRAIWASPSHRGNLLMGEYKRAGVAVVRDANGRVWVTELFAG
ncbi:MAG TPA: CAP domain-containing protein [Candidatus Nanopelagicales bacterium]|nr:CAP domain-containing protein [Candidatus Nanopelagicales bacterium]